MNCKRRTFCGENRNTRARTVRAGRGLAVLLAALAAVVLTPGLALGSLTLDVGTQTLIGDESTPQTIQLFVDNDGSPITVGSINFYIELGSGSGTMPYISSVDLLTSTIFSAGSQKADINNGPQLQYYGVLKGGTTPELEPGMNLLATISFVTTGVTSGSFSLSLSPDGYPPTDYFTDDASPQPIGLQLTDGTLDVVPEPSNVVAATFMLLFVGFHVIRQLRPRART